VSPGRGLAAGLSAGSGALALLLLVEAWIARAGMRPCFVDPSREVVVQGGPRLVYAVLGDSTGAGQGAPYQQGIAMATARHLARTHTVELTNLSASGATLVEVLRDQAGPAGRLRADLVLVALGANEVTHLTRRPRLRARLVILVERLLEARSDTRIVLTGAPDMGAVPRFA
jgi:lysophospholipase L1-like esterase